MIDATVPVAMLFATLGLMLGFAPRRIAFAAAAVSIVVALTLASLTRFNITDAAVVPAVWLVILVLSGLVYWPRYQSTALTIALAVLTAIVGGLAMAPISRPISFAAVLPLLVTVPASFAVGRGLSIAPRVLMAWLLAVSMLGAALPHVVSHPGYIPDHRG